MGMYFALNVFPSFTRVTWLDVTNFAWRYTSNVNNTNNACKVKNAR